MGIGYGDGVGIMCRDHRGLVETMFAAGKLGAKLLLMNTGFAKPQFAEVVEREGADVLVYDEEFADILGQRSRLGSRATSPGPTATTTSTARCRI